jgi:pyruvate,water dikinase
VPEAHHAFFDELLAEARLVHPLRDGHSVIDFWAFGLLRRSLLEAGRRLHARGALRAPDHVVDLEHGELVALLRGGEGPSPDRVALYVRQRRSLTTEDAPDRLGPPPLPPPPPEWLPPPARRIAEAMGVYIGTMWAPERSARPRTLVSGVGASAGTYTGRARVITQPADFARVEQGDVLIARITTASYNVLLPLLGAVVTDRGGLLSHPAIVAREYGIPGVVGCRDATLRIPDGARVEVDGGAGTVKVLS